MTKIKLCGLTRPADIEAANELRPDYIGFVFAKSKRYVSPETAASLKRHLTPGIRAVGVFVNEQPEIIAELLRSGVIDLAQLHGAETEAELQRLRSLTDKPLIQAFQIKTAQDAAAAQVSSADFILLDAGAGDGRTFDWTLLQALTRPYFLAGGLHPGNVGAAVARLKPYAVDVSSGIETDGRKDAAKMAAFVQEVRGGKDEAP